MIAREILTKIDKNRQRYVDELLGFLSIPSVSTYAQNAGDVRRAAEWVFNQLKGLGFQVEIHETTGHPVVFGQWCSHDAGPTLLIYGHYDVQPPEPLDEWLTPPFQPTIKNDYVYARGATDDKGQFFTYLKAIEAIMAAEGQLPINVKILVEGEEEIGSPGLVPFLKSRKEMLQADAVAISDTSQFKNGMPAITYGLRGLLYFQVEVNGPRFDLHSGSFGGLIANPIQILSEMLAGLHDVNGRVTIPDFYKDVLPIENWERMEMASLNYDENDLKDYLGVRTLWGETEYTPMERKTARPCLDVNGIWGGFSGEGAKTIIPSRAGAKVSMRLVPNQQAETVSRLFQAHMQSLNPKGMELKVTELNGADPVLVKRDRPSVQAAARAIEIGFGKAPVFIREGGSIPIVNLLQNELKIDDMLLLGWGSPDDGAHSPNERFSLEDFHKGIRSAAALFYEMRAR